MKTENKQTENIGSLIYSIFAKFAEEKF